MSHIAESTHWYDAKGNPAYEVKGANGNMRPTTLRDARKLNLYPSVTTVIKSAAAPALEMWKANQLMMAALTLPRLQDEPESTWLDRVKRDSREQGRKAAERGTAIHAAIQGHYEGKPPAEEYWSHVVGTRDTLTEFFRDVWPTEDAPAWIVEQSFSHRFGYGGKVDAHNSLGIVIDFKTKEFNSDSKLDTWDEHAMQLAAYRVGLGMPDARCAIVYVSVTVPGLAKVMELEATDLKQGWNMFQGLLSYWQAKNNYYPFEKAAA